MNEKKILVTAALPYANGDIHIGHLVEYLQADFWVRYQKLRGRHCLYFCADDTHGTPIMIRAREEGISPEQLIAESQKKHLSDFTDFGIEFDHYGSTHLDENRQLCEKFYQAMVDNKKIEIRGIKQAYCENDKMFLPDRFVKGSCPKCKAQDQYGDSCDECGATYSPLEMKDAQCSLCGHPPVERESEHIFFKLGEFKDFLKDWVPAHTPVEVSNKLNEWLKGDLRDWDISRDEPYFGFEIPDKPGKFFYVWVDAPIGYIATTWLWCKKNNISLDELWGKDSEWEIFHFIGKDIVYFHTLFWPAMLKNIGFNKPKNIFVHGFLTVNGQKMSKSKGTFINARTYLNHLSPLYLRYYYASKLSSGVDDIDLSFVDFVGRVNSDLVGKISNLASRGAQMLHKRIDGKMGELTEEGQKLCQWAQSKSLLIENHFEKLDFSKVIVEVRAIADEANRYFDEKAPWKMIKEDPEKTRKVLTDILNVFRILCVYLKPFIPQYVEQVEKLLGGQPLGWDSLKDRLENFKIEPFEHLCVRLEKESIDQMVEKSKVSNLEKKSKSLVLDQAQKESYITIDDFMKIDLRIGTIVSAEVIEKADKLLKLEVDLGNEKRQIIAGLRQAYRPDNLIGRQVVIVANLQPRKMKFGLSQGMVLASGEGGKDIFILSPDQGAKNGQRVK